MKKENIQKSILSFTIFALLVSFNLLVMADNNTIEINSPEIINFGENFDVSLNVPENTYALEAAVTVKYSDGTEESKKLVYVQGIADFTNLLTFPANVPGNAEITFSNIILCDKDSNIIETEKSKTKSIKIEKKLTGLTLNYKRASINISKQNTLQLIPILSPVDSTDLENIIWSSSDESIATVDKNGLVTAKSTGIGNVTIVARCGNFTASCDVIVSDKVINTTLDVKSVGNNFVIYSDYKTAVEKFLIEENFPAIISSTVKLFDSQGNEKSTSSRVGSKDVVKITDSQNNILGEYVIVVPGDINGDGQVKMYDAFTILKGTLFAETLNEIDTLIRDYNDDGKVKMYDAFSFLKDSLFNY